MKKVLVIVCLICFLSSQSFALFAPRAMGMGGAFTAISDDAFAAYWNPAGLAINPGVDIAGSYQINNRNRQIGDNYLGLKGCFEIEMDPFAWILGVGAASMFAYEGAKYLGDRGIVKKGWGREGEKYSKEESMSETITKEDVEDKKQDVVISKKVTAKEAAKEVAKGTIHVGEKFAKAALSSATVQVNNYYGASPYYHPNYYRPNYWDNRYAYPEPELTPAGKAQFAGGISIMTDQNSALNQDTNWYTFSIASGWGEIAALGTNFNIYDLKIPSSGTKGLGAGFDVGALLRFSDKLTFGLVAKELLTTDIKWTNGSTTRYQMNVNVGMSMKPIQMLTVAADMQNVFGQNGTDPTTHDGVEFRPLYGVALRGGLYDGNKTAGASIGIEQLIIDYAIVGGSFNRTQMLSLSWAM